MLEVGEQLGHYRIRSILGVGGMGEVFLAEDTRLRRQVALKVLPKTLDSDKGRLRRFKLEALAASALNHPNILTIFEFDSVEEKYFLATEFIKGETLRERLDRSNIPPGEALDITIQIASALEAAHASGIIHRDIKPENVMIRSDGLVKVLDFGLAKLTEKNGANSDPEAETRALLKTAPGMVMGTVAYMSPEQARGKPVDPRSDIFSLGVLFYELLTGKQPFTGETTNHTIVAILEKAPPPLSEYIDDPPLNIEKIIQKCLAKNPTDRYPTSKDLLDDLNAIKKEVDLPENLKQKMRADISPTIKTKIFAAETGKTINEPTGSTVKLPTRKNALLEITGRAKRTIQSRGSAPVIAALILTALLGYFMAPLFWRYKPKDEALKMFNNGMEAMREGSYYKASKMFEDAVRVDGNFAKAHAGLAEALIELDYLGRAQSEMLKVKEIQSEKQTLYAAFYETEDSLYVDAINATVMHNFPKAIGIYQKIAGLNPNDPHVYLDLGRAYEKNEDLDKALENYEKATGMDQAYAAAFLRLGVLNLRKSEAGSINNAAEWFGKAQQLYDRQSNFEGMTECLYWQGVLFNKTNDYDQATSVLNQSLKWAELNNNYYQQIRILLQLSNVGANVQETDRAKKYAEQAIELAQRESMETLATQGLIDLGNSFFAKTKLDEAEKYFMQAYKFASLGEAGRNKARAQLSLASLRLQQDNPDDALKFIEESLEFYRKGGYYQETARALVLKAQAMEIKGEYDLALEAFNEQLEISPQIKDKLQIAISHEGIGKILSNREQFPEAFSHFQKSCEIYIALNKKINAGYSLMYQSNMLWKLGRFGEAGEILNQAVKYAKNDDGGDNSLMFWILLNESRMALSNRAAQLALDKAKQASAAAPPVIGFIESKITYAGALKLSGSESQAKQTCTEALNEAKKTPDPKLKADAELMCAGIMQESGDDALALKFASEAQSVFARLHQNESLWRVLLIAGRANLKSGNFLQAKDCFMKSEDALAELARAWGQEAFDGYAKRPDIGSYITQLRDELGKLRN